MQRNMDLVRQILIRLEDIDGPAEFHDLGFQWESGDAVDRQLIAFHLRLLIENKWVDKRWRQYAPHDKEREISLSEFWLTDRGCDVVEIIADETRWLHLQRLISERKAVVTFDTVWKAVQRVVMGKL